ncbi:hypothetical protein AA313_de0205502 [Arthrobotrys entomopaga]|nr:hypothetical protein AA313_de0205502 [Arthrobotrys entomopaga]
MSSVTGVSVATLFQLNPSISRKCFSLPIGWSYCIHIPGQDASPSSTTTTPTPDTPDPTTTTTTTAMITTQKPTTTRATTTTTTARTTTTSSVPVHPPPVPDQFPPKQGKTTQCVRAFSSGNFPDGSIQPYVLWGDELTQGIQQACAKLIPGQSKWLEKGNPYTVSVPIYGRTMYFHMKIWLGGFPVPVDTCVSQVNAIFENCYSDTNPRSSGRIGGSVGGCSYTDDLNLQVCFFPTGVCDPSLPAGACDA